jgi:hypothetical protein
MRFLLSLVVLLAGLGVAFVCHPEQEDGYQTAGRISMAWAVQGVH